MKLKQVIPLCLLVLAICLSYSNNLHNSFVWDDEFLIQKNSYLSSFSYLSKMMVSNSTAGFGGQDSFYRPTQNIYYLFINQLFGQSEVAFHIGNILLHTLNALLIFLLLLKIFKQPLMAFSASLLWGTHPAHVEAITYISGTADPMGTLFFLCSALALPLGKIKSNIPGYLLSVLFFVLALLSKEALIVTPALLTLILFLKTEKKWHIKSYLPTLSFWAIALFYLILRKTLLNFDKTFSFYKKTNIYTENISYRVYTYLATLPEYLKILFYPTDLRMERDFPVFTSLLQPPVWIGLTLLLLSLLFSIILIRKYNNFTALFCWLWFFGAFVPMNGILLPVNSFILEHWLYLSSISIFIALGFAVESLYKKNHFLAYACLLVCTSTLIFLTRANNKIWKTPISFYSHILKYSEGSARVHNNIAMAYSSNKSWDLAIHHYTTAIKLSDIYPQTHHNLARAYIQTGQYDKALKQLNRALEIRPSFSHSLQLKSELLHFLKKNQ